MKKARRGERFSSRRARREAQQGERLMDLKDPLGKKLKKKIKILSYLLCRRDVSKRRLQWLAFLPPKTLASAACLLPLQQFSLAVLLRFSLLRRSLQVRFWSFFFFFSPLLLLLLLRRPCLSVEGLDLWLIFGHLCACRWLDAGALSSLCLFCSWACWCSVFSLSILFFSFLMARWHALLILLSLSVALCC